MMMGPVERFDVCLVTLALIADSKIQCGSTEDQVGIAETTIEF